MFTNRSIVPAMLILAVSGGCVSESRPQRSAPPFPVVTTPDDEVPPAVYEAWRTKASYYALLQIVDAHIDPSSHHASKQDVIQHIGRGCDTPDGYPNAGPNFWVYFSSRSIPYGSYLYVEFGDDGYVKEISWGSE